MCIRDRLQSYDRKELSSKNKLTYDVLEDYLSSSVKEAKFSLYDEPLAPLTGTQSQLPVLLSEYQFYDCLLYTSGAPSGSASDLRLTDIR